MPKCREADGHSEHRGVSSRCKVLHGTLPASLQNPGHSHPWLMTQKLQVTSILQSVRGRGGQEDEMPQVLRNPLGSVPGQGAPRMEGRQGWPSPLLTPVSWSGGRNAGNAAVLR